MVFRGTAAPYLRAKMTRNITTGGIPQCSVTDTLGRELTADGVHVSESSEIEEQPLISTLQSECHL